MVKVRPARLADLRRLAEIHVAGWRAAYRGILADPFLDRLSVDERERWRVGRFPQMGPGEAMLVGLEGEVLSGFADIGACRDGEHGGELYAIYVDPGRWGGGVGRALLAAAEEAMEGAGFASACLWVLEGNDRARHFYEASGWFADGATKIEMIGGVEAVEVRYWKDLAIRSASARSSE